MKKLLSFLSRLMEETCIQDIHHTEKSSLDEKDDVPFFFFSKNKCCFNFFLFFNPLNN